MAADGKGNRARDPLRADRVGKVFVALDRGMRRCLVCDGLFTARAAADHAGTVCHPRERDSRMGEGGK